MCGIAGYADFSSKTNPEILRLMTDGIIYRGPDSQGEYFSKDKIAALGVRRLSIIDLVTGDQPISNEDGTITVVYNGEIYNYRGLRKNLIKKGHKFKTKSDTETLVHLYEEYGENMTKYLNGMFTFAIWDEKKQKLFIARDRAGIKPLYYFNKGKLLVFGSEVKTLLMYPSFDKKIDLEVLNLYCYFGYIPSNHSIFSNVYKLPPGHTLTMTNSGVKVKKYFEISTNKHSDKSLDNLLDDAVVSQLHADVPVGIFLSGGLDSSLLSYYVTKSNKKIKSFSISFEEESFDESKYARAVAHKLGTQHYDESFRAKDVFDLFGEITEKLDEPFADASFFPTYKVSRLARKHVKVVLSGDGGDELFGGYPTYQAQMIAETLKYFPKKLIDSGLFLLNFLPTSFENYPKKTLAKIFATSIKMEPYERQIYMMRTFFLGETILRKKPNLNKLKGAMPEISKVGSITLKAQIIDFYTYLRDDFLFKTDRASMYNSLEVRVPYLDNHLIDFAFSSGKKHVNLFQTKILLRKLAMEKLKLPEIANRPKKGFGIPTAKWLRGELKDFGYSMLQNNKLEDYVDKKKIKMLWQEHQQMQRNNGGTLWMLIMLSGWLDNWA